MSSACAKPVVPAAKAPRTGPLARAADSVKKRLGAWITDVEYRLRVWSPFTVGRGAKRVFYPGCSLPAADPELVMRAHAWLKARDPEIEMWSDCCGMPLEKFGSPEAAARGRDRTRRMLREAGTTEIITACGNCTVQLDSLKVPGLKLTSLYGVLAEADADLSPREASGPMVVHHPCSARIDKEQQTHFRALAGKLHLNVVNADDKKHPLSCCLVKTPAAMQKRQALEGQQLLTYCAHCTMDFGTDVPTRHVLQEIFGKPGEQWAPRGKVSRFRQYARLVDLARLAASPEKPRSLGSRGPVRAAIALLLVAAVVVAGRQLPLAQLALALVSWSRAAGPLGVLAYALGYVASTVLLLPGSVLTLGAGFAWGSVYGVAVVSPVSVLAATASFALGRSLLRARVEKRVGNDPRVAAIDRAIREQGLKIVILLRLSPILPFNLLNYALSLTKVRLRDYVLGSAIGMFPATLLFVHLGSLIQSGAELASGRRPAGGTAGALLTWGGLAATLAVVVLVSRLARRALDEALAEGSG